MNYRSIVAFGTAREVVDPEQKVKSLRVISEHLIAGPWADVRGPSEKELKATTVLEFSIEEASSRCEVDRPWTTRATAGCRYGLGYCRLRLNLARLYQTTN
jgi:hypothetical protein